MKKAEPETNKMDPKKTRAVIAKAKELEYLVIPLVKRLQNIKNAKVQEVSWEKQWAGFKVLSLQETPLGCISRMPGNLNIFTVF